MRFLRLAPLPDRGLWGLVFTRAAITPASLNSHKPSHVLGAMRESDDEELGLVGRAPSLASGPACRVRPLAFQCNTLATVPASCERIPPRPPQMPGAREEDAECSLQCVWAEFL